MDGQSSQPPAPLDAAQSLASSLALLKKQRQMFQAALTLVLLILLVNCLLAALSITRIAPILEDMVPAFDLPLVTQYLIKHVLSCFVAALLFAVIGFGSLVRGRHNGGGLLAAGVAALLLFAEWQVVTYGMQSPLIQLINEFGAPK